MSDMEPLRIETVTRDPRTLTLLTENARWMSKAEYDKLVANMRADGACTSSPLLWCDPDGDGSEIVLSGNHRTRASIDAGLDEITCLLITQPLSKDRQLALQLSHNAIAGQDDQEVLAQLYASIDDVDLRAYTGLDDKALGLLDTVHPESLGEAALEYATVALLFLPEELERMRAVWDEAVRVVDADEVLAARYSDHAAFLAALDTARGSHRVGSAAIAIGVLTELVERHLGELRDGWLDPESGELQDGVRASTRVPVETILETRTLPAESAARLARAVDRARERGEIPAGEPWALLDLLVESYLAR